MCAALFAWFAFRCSPCTKASSSSADKNLHCVFCDACSGNRDAFDVVWEDADFLAFRDRNPASLHHIQLIPKVHISSVKEFKRRDVDTVRRMEIIGNDILDRLEIPLTHRKMGFHIPPFTSVQHLHLHVQALPYISFFRQLKYPVVRGYGTFNKGFSWFAEVGQTARILEQGSTVGILPC